MANGTILKDKGKDWILLWKNSNTSPSQTFAAQTVEFDRKNCVEYQLWFMDGIGTSNATVTFIRADGLWSGSATNNYSSNNNLYVRRRGYYLTDKGMYFYNGQENHGTSNTSMIPYAIYGR